MLSIYEQVGPTSNLWDKICDNRREVAMGIDKWNAIKDVIKQH
jgi:hypothetical protein